MDLNELWEGVDYHVGSTLRNFMDMDYSGKILSLSGNELDENGMLNTSTYDYVDNLYVLLLLRARYALDYILVAMTIIMKKIYIQKIVIYI